jgi:hypothetical protein
MVIVRVLFTPALRNSPITNKESVDAGAAVVVVLKNLDQFAAVAFLETDTVFTTDVLTDNVYEVAAARVTGATSLNNTNPEVPLRSDILTVISVPATVTPAKASLTERVPDPDTDAILIDSASIVIAPGVKLWLSA